MKKIIIPSLLLLASLILAVGCSSDKANPLASFEPEIIADADAFQFQATAVKNVTTTVEYTWDNTSTSATVNHSSVITGGEATVTIFDADSTQVYTNGLAASLNEGTQTGTAGAWRVRVTLTNLSGTLNFRVEKG